MALAVLGVKEQEEGEGEHGGEDANDDGDARAKGCGQGVEGGRSGRGRVGDAGETIITGDGRRG